MNKIEEIVFIFLKLEYFDSDSSYNSVTHTDTYTSTTHTFRNY